MVYKFTLSISNFDQEIYDNVIKKTFPNMNAYAAKILLKYFLRTIDIIGYCFDFTHIGENEEDFELFVRKLRSENYKDCFGILYLLLPFINDESDKSKIISLNDIYIAKKKSANINLEEPKYEFSNLQYGRCIREDNIKEIVFTEDHLKQNFKLLMETIRIVSKKLCINWINVIPVTPIIYSQRREGLKRFCEHIIQVIDNNKPARTSPFYMTKVLERVGEIRDYDVEGKDDEKLLYLENFQLDHIYDTITNFLYYDVKNVKWLIFDVIAENKIVPVLVLLRIYFGDVIDNASGGMKWTELDKKIKRSFSANWNGLIRGDKKDILIEDDEFRKLLRSIVIYFDNYYKQKNYLLKKGKYISINSPNDEEEDIGYVNYDKIIKSAESLNSEYVYDFLRESLDIFKNTFYGNLIYSDAYNTTIKTIDQIADGLKFSDLSDWKIKRVKTPTCKNIYNFAKSFCHYMDDANNYRELPRFWKSFTDKMKLDIIHRIGDLEEYQKWFNISNNIKNTYGKLLRTQNITEINEQIYLVINKNISDIVCSVLVTKGLMSFVSFADNSVSSSIISTSSTDERIVNHVQTLLQNYEYEKHIFFLTNKPYDYHYTIVSDENTKEPIYVSYTDYITNKHYKEPTKNSVWYKAYALDWISQINFFHKYLNNRIIYVTGSTGVGKSTVVPILLLYAMKAIDYKENGKLICTQPRTTPTINNARTVSGQLGVPIETIKTSRKAATYINNINRSNYSVQFKYRGRKHISDISGLMLRFVTDGSLNLELSNPLLKKTIMDNNGISYTPDNMYDIIAVDEAHEHNANIDMILTYMRYVVNYNNSVKLVIISATMEDDEPVYRRYYRDINDNRMYPLDHNLLTLGLDRINVDRRLHISPPGQTTKHKITEYYINDHLITDPVTIAMDIVNKDPDGGDILLFRSGQGEILKDLDKLNKMLPQNTIALPYYSQLNPEKKKIIESIHDLKFFIRMNKTDDFNIVDPMQGTNRYKRVVILATNIAEASITIKTLKYVIETGKQKTSRYNYKKRMSVLTEDNISESSRLQRKGRVGRTGPGTVYYTYEKGTMENNKTQFNIAIQEIGMELYRRLFENSSDKIIFDSTNDPNNPNNKIDTNNLQSKYSNGIDKIIQNQYFIQDNFFTYYGNKHEYDYDNYKSLPTYYETGFSINTLTDSTGMFYLIHPEELNIKRNIIGIITGLTETAKENDVSIADGKINSEKINSFWDTMYNNLYLMIEGKTVFKTKFGKTMQKLQELMEFDDQRQFISYLYSRAYNVDESMIRIICFIRSVGKFSDNFISTINFMRQIDKVKKMVGEQQSDIFAILEILNNIHEMIDVDIDISEKNYLKKRNLYYTYLTHEPVRKIIDSNNLDKLLKEYNDNMNEDLYNKLYEERIPSMITNELIKIYYQEKLKNYCDKINIKYESIMNYIEKYLDFKNTIYIAENGDNENLQVLNIYDVTTIIRNNLIDKTLLSEYDKMTASLIVGYPYNMVKNIRKTPFYLSLYNPSVDNVYKIQNVGRSKFLDTLTDRIYNSQYMLYINSDIEKNTISIVHYINPNMLKMVSNIYNPTKMSYIYYKYKLNIFSDVKDNVTAEVLSNYRETLDEVKNDIEIYNSNKIQMGAKNVENELKNLLVGGFKIDKRLYKYVEKLKKKELTS